MTLKNVVISHLPYLPIPLSRLNVILASVIIGLVA